MGECAFLQAYLNMLYYARKAPKIRGFFLFMTDAHVGRTDTSFETADGR